MAKSANPSLVGSEPPGGGRRYLIINADDFGTSHGVNQGIVEVYRAGVLTSASLMVTRPAAEPAVELAAELPRLSVGLHTDLTGEDGPPRVDIGDPDAVAAELDRQVDRFHQLTGRGPSHLDAHHNLHRRPSLTPVFAAAAAELDVPLRENSPVRYFPDFYAQWDGVTHPEQVTPENLRRMLTEEIGPGITELACHPGRYDPEFHSSYHRERELELATLADPTLVEFLADHDIILIDYHRAAELLAFAGDGSDPESEKSESESEGPGSDAAGGGDR
jgi:predicted glycoside hydrolase/deacetylase ChbG (UPF0249 family)